MNNLNPIIPQGSVLEQKNRGRARVRIVVFSVLAIHVLGVLVALLMQGCKQDKPAASDASQTAAATAPAFDSNAAPATTSNPAATAATAPATAPATTTPPPQPAVPSGATTPVAAVPQDYVIVQGDNFSGLAKKFGVTAKAIMDANPGVEPTKLQIGEKIHIPAPTATVASASPTAPAAAAADPGTGEGMYIVKSGDTLTAIARQYGVRVRAIRSANSLSTDMIHVGQKLKIPAKAANSPTITTASNAATDSSPTPSSPPLPRQ